MKFRFFFFRFSTAVAAFILGVTFFCLWQWLPNIWPVKKYEAVKTAESNVRPVITKTPEIRSESEPVSLRSHLFDKGGYYYIPGKRPKAFGGELIEFHVERLDYDEKNDRLFRVAPTGFLSTGFLETEKTYEFQTVVLENDEITFETKTVNGISFQFSGKLVAQPQMKKEEPIFLRGHLKKIKNGQIVAAGNFGFTWYSGGC